MGIGNLEEEAKKRKERLKILREQRDKPHDAPSAKRTDKGELPKPDLKLRNYQPITEDMKEKKLDDSKPGVIEEHIKDQLEGEAPMPMITDDVDIFNLAPRKPDWDLKRDIKPKLERLERRTQRAIAEIIRERLKESVKDESVVISDVPDVSQEAYDSD